MTPSQPDDLRDRIHALQRFTRALCRDHHDAEDASQGALLGALESGRWSSEVLRAFGSDRLRSARRADARRRRREASAAAPESAADPNEHMQRLELEERLIAQVRALPAAQAEAIYLRYWEGLSCRAIANRTGASNEAVKTRLKRGLATLREQLDRETPGGREEWLASLAPACGGMIMKKSVAATAVAFVALAGGAGIALSGFGRGTQPAVPTATKPVAHAQGTEELASAAQIPLDSVGTDRERVGAGGAPTTDAEPITFVRGHFIVAEETGPRWPALDGSVKVVFFGADGVIFETSLEVDNGSFAMTGSRRGDGTLLSGAGTIAAPNQSTITSARLYTPYIDCIGHTQFVNEHAALIAHTVEFEPLAGEELELRLRLAPETWLVATDRDTGAPLNGGEVLSSYFSDWMAPEHPQGVTTNVLHTDASSPMRLIPPVRTMTLDRVACFVRAPGYGWRKVQVNFRRGGEHFAELAPGGSVRVQINGVAPPGTVLHLRQNDRGLPSSKHSLSDSLIAKWPHVEAGAWVVEAFVGERRIDECEITVEAGSETVATLDLAELAAPQLVTVSGEITVPPAWGFLDVNVDIMGEFTSASGTPQRAKIALSDLRVLSAEAGRYALELPRLQPGSYRAFYDLPHAAQVAGDATQRLSFSEPFEVPEGGTNGLRLSLPEARKVTLHVRSAPTGEAVREISVVWSAWRGPNGHSTGAIGRPMSNADGAFTIKVPASIVEAHVSADGHTGASVRLDARRESTRDVALSPETIAIVRFLEGDNVVHPELRERITIAPTDGDASVVSTSIFGTRVSLRSGGEVTWTFPPMDGYEPTPAQTAHIPSGRTTTVDVQLTRR